MDKTGITIASAATGTYNMIIEAAKGEVARTENISKEEMIKRLDTIFLQNSDDEYKASVNCCTSGSGCVSEGNGTQWKVLDNYIFNLKRDEVVFFISLFLCSFSGRG